jgi:hypothetical protein
MLIPGLACDAAVDRAGTVQGDASGLAGAAGEVRRRVLAREARVGVGVPVGARPVEGRVARRTVGRAGVGELHVEAPPTITQDSPTPHVPFG